MTQDDGRVGDGRRASEHSRVQGDSYLLGQLLATAGLIGATIEYAEIIKRRGITRRAATMREESADLGLQGLVRVLLVEEGETGLPHQSSPA